ncbi:MAG: ShlB/FhaC/HecB family hemolysin secretion/activation protein [Thiotrichales bacterium]
MNYNYLENNNGDNSEVFDSWHGDKNILPWLVWLCLSVAQIANGQSQASGAQSSPAVSQRQSQSLFDAQTVFVAQVQFEGNTVFSDKELSTLVEPLLGKRLAVPDLLNLKKVVTGHYVNQGYITSEAIIPDQQVERGLLRLTIREGLLSSIILFDAADLYLRPNYIRKRIAPEPAPLNVNMLKENIELLHLDERISSIKASLLPGVLPEQRELGLEIKEAKRYSAGLTVANSRSPSVGEFEAGIWYRNINLTGGGDELNLSLGASEGVSSAGISYRFPVTAKNDSISLSYQVSDSVIIEEPFNELDIESKTKVASLIYEHPFYQAPKGYLKAHFQVDRKNNLSTIGGGVLNFLLEENDGQLEISVARTGLRYLHKAHHQVTLFAIEYSMGIDGANLQSQALDFELVSPDPSFKKVNLQLLYLYQPKRTKYSASLTGQYAFDQLYSMEKFGIGGVNSLRGYRENLFVRDHGISVQLEAAKPVYGESLSLSVFSDAGYAAESGAPSNHRFASSIGLGLLWKPQKNMVLNIIWGHELQSVIHNDDESLQDQGLHVRLELRAI